MNLICQNCKKTIDCPDFGDGVLDESDVYEYRGFLFHQKCFDEGCKKVDLKRQEIVEATDKMIRSQADGEWHNGGYKYMKTDSSGKPITKINTPKIVEDYEKGIL